jgi:hypothetical protein
MTTLTRLPSDLLFDDNALAIGNRDIDECVGKFGDGRTDFPTAEELAFACEVLLIMGGLQQDRVGRRLVAMLEDSRGVSYSAVVPLMVDIRQRTALSIVKARQLRAAENKRVPIDESDLPF